MRTALVTGASSGIGEATARRLAAEGYRLMIVARRAERLEALAHELGEGTVAVAADLTDADAPARVRAQVDERFGGRLDLLVNNAGASWRAAFGDPQRGGFENVRRTMAVNFDAAVRLTEALLPAVRAAAPSAIVNVSSVAGRVASPRGGAYSASKFALIGWSEALGFEEAAHGVHVGLVLPGFIATEGFPQTEIRPRFIVSKPEKVADAILSAARGRHEVIVPRGYRIVPLVAALAPGLVRRVAARRR